MLFFAQATPGASASLWPFAVLAICLVAIIVLITKLRVHAFLSLIFAAFLAGFLSSKLPGEIGTTNNPATEKTHWVQAVELTAAEFGSTAGKITLVIALAAIIGTCLMESGAADKVVRRFIALFGEKRAGGAITSSSYIMSIPIFFDTFYMLLLPLAKAMRLRTGKNYVLYTMAICCAGVVTHSLLVPHPGPLLMAQILDINLGVTIMVGFVAGIVPVFASWTYVKWLSKYFDIPLRDTQSGSVASLEAIANKPESELPNLWASIIPVVLPIVLISLASIFAAVPSLKENKALYQLIDFLGNRNVALLIGTFFAVHLYMRQMKLTLAQVFEKMNGPLETAGMIILITSAGGAFGLMLKNAGLGDAIQALMKGREVNVLLLSWTVATVIRIAQGSATVAMLTTAAMLAPMVTPDLPYHPVYVFLAIGFGAMTCSWMNDSGFWVVGRLSGFTEKETLKTWTVIVTINSIVGLVVTLIGSYLVPLK